jgi:hypothetical protein
LRLIVLVVAVVLFLILVRSRCFIDCAENVVLLVVGGTQSSFSRPWPVGEHVAAAAFALDVKESKVFVSSSVELDLDFFAAVLVSFRVKRPKSDLLQVLDLQRSEKSVCICGCTVSGDFG